MIKPISSFDKSMYSSFAFIFLLLLSSASFCFLLLPSSFLRYVWFVQYFVARMLPMPVMVYVFYQSDWSKMPVSDFTKKPIYEQVNERLV